ncbi:amidase [Bacillus sp. GM2]|uniref:amidase n=1 Tax=Bacillus TaxID=1386 RepID=UPI0003A81A25|nr:amidase [Bacillus paralicheniformis]MSN98984.1 amidase [Bacillus paralicheniformis]MSO02992.1 amidase [Bacillus paralicheniformis]MSO06985.1 amidase [Bacillus paralicheniformis]MSO10979.1 amidase [Bacillus paralicheniformis]NJE35936.1 amidase [Bacillus paralicheniformis]
MEHDLGAFMNRDLAVEPASAEGSLKNLSFAVKDVFAVEGHTNAAGNPDWLRTHEPAEKNAEAVDLLLGEGARLKGAAHTDELMYSLDGENVHYGTPVNPCAKDNIPGGSSSGSAVAAASGMADFALGTDTGGSVRIPSSYCGIFGFRPTHGEVPVDGVIPLAKSFDTVGWMSKDIGVLHAAGRVLLSGQEEAGACFNRIYFEKEAWSLLEESDRTQVYAHALSLIDGEFDWCVAADGGLAEWAEMFRVLQALDIWEEHGAWIERTNPVFSPGIAERFEWASSLRKSDHEHVFMKREAVKRRLSEWLAEDGLLVTPTAPGTPPLRGLPENELHERRARTMKLTCIAGLSGLPQITVPLPAKNGKPLGLSFIAGRKQDLKLLAWTEKHVLSLQV